MSDRRRVVALERAFEKTVEPLRVRPAIVKKLLERREEPHPPRPPEP